MPAGSFHFLRDYSAMVILAVGVVALAAWIQTSPFGQALRAIRQDIDAAEALGVNSTKYKVLVHALSAAIVAVAGSLFAVNFQYISPSSVFDFRLSLSIVLMPIVGGLGTVAGPVLGGLLFGYLQIKLLSSPALRDSNLFLYGGMLILVMLFEPKGLSVSTDSGAVALVSDGPQCGGLLVDGLVKRFAGCSLAESISRFRRIFGVIGPNGAGKTTLPAWWARSDQLRRGRFRRKRIGASPTTRSSRGGLVRTRPVVRPFRDMTVIENVSIAAHFGRGRRRGGGPPPHLGEPELTGLARRRTRSRGR
jgi:branched-chain amino acid transport system permease protein